MRILATLGLGFGVAMAALAKSPPPDSVHVDAHVPAISYVSFPSAGTPSHTVSGQLRVPADAKGVVPAVVIVHGSAGIDSRGAFYASALNRAGIATLEIDLWSARGFLGGLPVTRPRGVPETLPDAYGALQFLAGVKYPDSGASRFDPARIGIMGFSWGGVVSMLTATQPYTEQLGGGLKFAAHAPNYPVCWVYNRVPGYGFSSFTGAPVFIQAGALDAYDLPPGVASLPGDANLCARLVHSLGGAQQFVSVTVYDDATHAWDRLQPAITVTDPFSHTGAGGTVDFIPNPRVAKRSRHATVEFFRGVFGLPGAPGDDD